jgi:hypothetical protein
METLRHKIRLIFMPFLRIAAGFMLVYTFLDWWLVIRQHVITWQLETVQLWLPFGLVWIPLLILLRLRINLLTPTRKKHGGGHLLVAALAIAAPTIFLQLYLETATGKLTGLVKISQIGTTPPTKYYTAQKYYAQKELAQTAKYSTVSTKGGKLYYTLYIATPLFDKQTIVIKDNNGPTKIGPNPKDNSDTVAYGKLPDSIQDRPRPLTKAITSSFDPGEVSLTVGPVEAGPSQAWVCVKYKKTISNYHSYADKEVVWKDFLEISQQEFDNLDLNHVSFLDRIGNTHNREYYEEAAEKSFLSSISKVPITILEPHYEPFSQRNGYNLAWAFIAFVLGGGLFLLTLVVSTLDPATLEARGYDLS